MSKIFITLYNLRVLLCVWMGSIYQTQDAELVTLYAHYAWEDSRINALGAISLFLMSRLDYTFMRVNV